MKKLTGHYGTIIAVAVMAIIALLFFYPDNTQGHVLQQHDMQQGIANSHEIAQYAAEHDGDTPRWTNSLFGGMPTFQIAPTYPSNSLFESLNRVYGLWLPSPSNILMMMMAGMFILLSVMRLRWYNALIGAIAWGFSTYFIIIIGAGHIWKFVTLAYVPPTIAGLLLAYRGRYMWGAGVTALFAMLQLASNHVQMTYYFGLVMALIVVCYGISMIRKGEWRRWAVATAVIAGGGTLAVVANLPSLYNTYHYSKETIRGGSELAAVSSPDGATGLDMDYLTQYSYGVGETYTLLIPNVKGGASSRLVAGRMQMMPVSDIDKDMELAYNSGLNDLERQYVQAYVTRYFGEPESTNGPVYVGAVIFALFILGCLVVKGPLKWALLTATLLSIGLAWGRNFMSLTELFVDIVPLYSQFRTPESILVIAEFAMPVLGVLALQQVLLSGDDRRRYRMPVAVSFGICIFICALGWIAPGVFGDPISQGDIMLSQQIRQAYASQGADPQLLSMFSINNPRIAAYVSELRLGMVSADAGRSLILLLLSGGLIYMVVAGAKTSRRMAVAATAGVGLLVFIDLYSVNKRYLSSDSFTEAPAGDKIAATEADKVIMQDTDMNYRVLDIPRFGEADPSYYHKSIGGYHAAKLSRYQDLIDRQIVNNNEMVLDMLNTRYIVTGPSATDVSYNPYALGNAWWISDIKYVDGAEAEMSALDTLQPAVSAVADRRFSDILGKASAPAAGDTIYETSYAPDRLTYRYRSANGGVAIFSEIYFPWGWNVTVNGKATELARANYVLRALRLPAGEGEIVMEFDPQSLHTTGTAATISIIIIYLLIAAAALSSYLRHRQRKAMQ